ncbi:MAG: 3-hydroxylacyl-ACP dehydratase [Acetobacteraceae bacterium]|nr:MAG: 3-hydroxylacyl-ACP dehydratase [Acetobacteraceae bacterium]
MLNPAEIAALVPHHGRMCLLDRALAWDATHIACATDRHRDPTNPLRRDGMLPALCGLEFGFQAMALHGALTSGAAQTRGFISSLREVVLGATRLDDIDGELRIEAEALVAEPGGSIYRFAVMAAGRSLLGGQAAVILAREAA